MSQEHPADGDLVAWVDGDLRGTSKHGEVARHVIRCRECAGLLLGQTKAKHADAAYELLRTSWRDLTP